MALPDGIDLDNNGDEGYNEKTTILEERMSAKEIKTPKHWKGEFYQPLIEAETIYGNKVKIPKIFSNGWQTAKMTYEEMKKRGLDHLDFLKSIQAPHLQTVVEICFEVYETKY